jgi:hypothetical protein
LKGSKAITLTPTILNSSAQAINYKGEYRITAIQNGSTSFLEFIHDYESDALFDASYRTGIAATGGYAATTNRLYFLSTQANAAGPYGGRVFREMDFYENTSYPEIAYADTIYSIPMEWMFILHNGTPSLDKTWLRLKLWSLFVEFYTTFIANTLTVSTYRNFSTAVANETFTLPFLSSTTFEAKRKLKSGLSRSLIFKISHDAIHVTPWITGWEVLFADTVAEEDLT